jgi:aryl-alcohol dehydrogenase-like predicted oxidoreductase
MQALRDSSVQRVSVFITTKIHPRDLGFNATLRAFERSLAAFDTPFIDLVLLHYPTCWGTLCETSAEGTWRDSWRALEHLVRARRVLAIGAPLGDFLSKLSTPSGVVLLYICSNTAALGGGLHLAVRQMV